MLVEQCYRCHSQEAAREGKLKGGLQVDTREGLLKGGESGPAVVPGKVEKSLLISAMRHGDLRMPPNRKLPDHVIADFEKWISLGAADPRGGKVAADKYHVDLDEAKQRWAFQPPRKHPSPPVKDASWPWTEIDRFLLSEMEQKGLKPTVDASPAVVLRRLSFDLIGLPPTPAEVDAFLRDHAKAPRAALERAVETLLQSPRFGERWGRHWLDVVRYGETNGMDANQNRP